ncbi:hypothetical protein PMAYCL1PPCAC_33400, partial [Pristionchus mayeri]
QVSSLVRKLQKQEELANAASSYWKSMYSDLEQRHIKIHAEKRSLEDGKRNAEKELEASKLRAKTAEDDVAYWLSKFENEEKRYDKIYDRNAKLEDNLDFFEGKYYALKEELKSLEKKDQERKDQLAKADKNLAELRIA